MGCFSPTLLWLKKNPKLTPHSGRAWADTKQQTLHSSSNTFLKAPCNLVPSFSPACWSHLVAMWGQDARTRKIERLGRPTRVGSWGDPCKPSSNAPCLILPLALCFGIGLAVPLAAYCAPRDGHATEHNTAKKAEFGVMGCTVCCIPPAGREEQIPKPRAMESGSYTTGIVLSFWLDTLPQGDMVFTTWPKMAKTAKFGRNGPHSRSHISMAMASNKLSKVSIGT